jgi:hypothetical protein
MAAHLFNKFGVQWIPMITTRRKQNDIGTYDYKNATTGAGILPQSAFSSERYHTYRCPGTVL